MLKVLIETFAMMAATFAIGFVVAWVISFVVKISENANLRENKGEELKRLNRIRRIRRKSIRQMMKDSDTAAEIELIDHYYGKKKTSKEEFGWNEAVSLFFPEAKSEHKSKKTQNKPTDDHGKI